jgi:outer membrane lipoprotein
MKKLKILYGLGLVLILAGCTSAIPKETLNQADQTVTFQAVARDPDQYKGKVILAGGQILGTSVREGQTWVEVLEHPLDWRQRPQDTDVSFGRFLIRFDTFLDPAIYTAGKKITVVGEVAGKQVLPLREMQYTYPVLSPRGHQLFSPETSYGRPAFNIGIGIGGVFH